MGEFIFQAPKWDPSLYFTAENINFLLTFVTLLIGILICLFGQRCLLSMLWILVGAGFGAFSVNFFQSKTSNPLVLMFLSIMVIFIEEGLIFYIYSVIGGAIKGNHGLRSGINLFLRFLAPVLGAACIALVLYFRVYTGLLIDIAIAVGFMVFGIIFRAIFHIETKEFHTYEDICGEEGYA